MEGDFSYELEESSNNVFSDKFEEFRKKHKKANRELTLNDKI